MRTWLDLNVWIVVLSARVFEIFTIASTLFAVFLLCRMMALARGDCRASVKRQRVGALRRQLIIAHL